MNWKYKIEIKHLFSEDTTPEIVAELCTILVSKLDKILEKSQKSNISEDSIDEFWYELEEVKDNFDFLRQLADGSIKEEDWKDYSFEGDFESWFNDYLEQLYDIGDIKIMLKNGTKEKLLWVG